MAEIELSSEVIIEEEKEVFKRFCHPKRLHFVLVAGNIRLDVSQGYVARRLYARVSVESPKNRLAPLLVFGILGDSIEIEECLDCLRSQQVERICSLEESSDRRRDQFISATLLAIT